MGDIQEPIPNTTKFETKQVTKKRQIELLWVANNYLVQEVSRLQSVQTDYLRLIPVCYAQDRMEVEHMEEIIRLRGLLEERDKNIYSLEEQLAVASSRIEYLEAHPENQVDLG